MSDTIRAWGDCCECGGEGTIEVKDQNWDNPDPPETKPCPACLAHFKPVDEAYARAIEDAAKVVESCEPGDVSRALGLPMQEVFAIQATAIRSLLPATHPQGQPQGGKE